MKAISSSTVPLHYKHITDIVSVKMNISGICEVWGKNKPLLASE